MLSDIERLLSDVASHITRWLRVPFAGTICVVPGPDTSVPMTYYRGDQDQPFVIQLTARNRKWSQFAYQFSHETCHVLSDYERLRDNPNNWFHEALCELASVFTLRRMAERWSAYPPYSNWADYAESLASYVQELLSRKERQLPAGMTLSAWLLSEEESLRRDCELRDKNAIVAYSLLPIFEGDPAGWNAIRKLPNSSGMFKDYLRDWHSLVELTEKSFVNRIIRLFEQ